MAQNYQFDFGPGLMGQISKILSLLLTGKIFLIVVVSVGVALVTFQILDIFMKKSLFIFEISKMNPRKGKLFRAALMLLIATVAPVVLAIGQVVSMFQSKKVDFFNSILSAGISLVIAIVLCWMLSLNMKRFMNKDDFKDKTLLFLEAFSIIVTIISENLASWIARLLVGVLNLAIKVIHIPFIMNYFVVSVLINLALSIILIQIVGVTQNMASANVIGSMIGGIAHARIRRHMRKELKDSYQKEYEEKRQRREQEERRRP